MPHPRSSPTDGQEDDGVNLRLVWPQWQGGGTTSVETFASEFPLDVARRGYAVGSIVLEAVLPPHDGPTGAVTVTMSDIDLENRDGVEAKAVILRHSRVAIHFDVDTIDSNEILLGLGPEPNGLTSAEVRRILADIDGAVDVVGLTIAEFIPRQVMHLQQLPSGFPLISGAAS